MRDEAHRSAATSSRTNKRKRERCPMTRNLPAYRIGLGEYRAKRSRGLPGRFSYPIAMMQYMMPNRIDCALVGSIGFEPTTPTMSRWCSNQLSYEPVEARIIEGLFARHKRIGEISSIRDAGRLRGRRWAAMRDSQRQRRRARCGHASVREVIHRCLWITTSQTDVFTVDRLRISVLASIRGRSCSSQHRAVHGPRVRL
jgi:hypothetical protein